jgi:DNA-binding transcriptional MerR regulator
LTLCKKIVILSKKGFAMALKMKDLVSKSGESKSTILYYLKEGLLPQPQKPKPNVALYDESCINIIKLIKYLQKNYNYSIEQIKQIFKNNNFDFNKNFESLINSVEILNGFVGAAKLSKKEFLKSANLTQKEFEDLIKEGFLFEREKFSQKDTEMVKIIKEAKEYNLDKTLLKAYIKAAKELAILENDEGQKVLADDTMPHNNRYQLLFDIILKYKPYIFNSYTVLEHQKRIKK